VTVNDVNKAMGALFGCLYNNVNLTNLRVAANCITTESTQRFVSCIGKLPFLRVLDLSVIKPKQVQPKAKENVAVLCLQVLKEIQDESQLETLAIADCEVGLPGAQLLKYLIHGRLKHLNVKGNQLFAAGACELFTTPVFTKRKQPSMCNLLTLDLSGNGIDGPGV
jgi:Ran GTPase-activating protein (RanGAP) involved in mRNA processing and transport